MAMGLVIIRMRPDSDKSHKKALKVAAEVRGVQSVTMTGMDRDLLLVTGDGVDANKLTKKLRREVGEAEIVELRTTTGEAGSSGSALKGGAIGHCRSPYQCHPSPGRGLQRGGRVSYPVPALPAAGSPAAARRWADEHSRQAAVAGYYYPCAPSPSYYYCASPVAWECGYGGSSSYALAAARSHPGHYCPVIERHDYRRRQSWARRQPGCCSIM